MWKGIWSYFYVFDKLGIVIILMYVIFFVSFIEVRIVPKYGLRCFFGKYLGLLSTLEETFYERQKIWRKINSWSNRS